MVKQAIARIWRRIGDLRDISIKDLRPIFSRETTILDGIFDEGGSIFFIFREPAVRVPLVEVMSGFMGYQVSETL